MPFVSVRNLNTLMALGLVVITAVICLALSMSASEQALTRTENTGTDGINSAFSTATSNVQTLSDSLMNQILTGTSNYISQFVTGLFQTMKTNQILFGYLANQTDGVGSTTRTRFDNFSAIMAASSSLYGQLFNGAAGTFFVGSRSGSGFILHTDGTLVTMLYSNGSDINQPWDAKWSLTGYVDAGLNWLQTNFPCNGPCSYLSQAQNFGPCPSTTISVSSCPVVNAATFDPLNQSFVSFAMHNVSEFDVGWMPPQSSGQYIGFVGVTPISSKWVSNPATGGRVGYFGMAVELTSVSTFLSTTSLPTGGVVFCIDLGTRTAMGVMIGVSRGNAFIPVYDNVTGALTARLPATCSESSDNVTAQVCAWLFSSLSSSAGPPDPNATYTVKLKEGLYFVRLTIVSKGSLSWGVIVAVPRTTIMASIDAAVTKTQQHIQSELDAVASAKQTMYTVMGVILACATVILIIFSIFFSFRITSPMIVLQWEMASVAEMDLEGVQTDRPISTLYEIGSMQTSFLKMCKNLKEFRNYMPHSLLSNDGEEEEDEEGAGQAAGGGDIGARKSAELVVEPMTPISPLGKKTPKRVKSGKSFRSRTSHDSHGSSINSKGAVGKAVVPTMDIKKKRITLMVVNLRGWHSICEKLGPDPAAQLHAQYIQRVLGIVRDNKGTADVFLGDRFTASWNTVKTVGTHRVNACTSACLVQESITELNAAQPKHHHASNATVLVVNVGVSSGEVQCGNMGCEGMKKYTFVGPCASFVHILERLNRHYKTAMLLDGAVEEDARNVFFVRKLDHVMVHRLQSRPFRVFELIGPKKASAEEWMYQLEEGEKADPYYPFGAALDAYFKGNSTEASTLLESVKIKDAQYERMKSLFAMAGGDSANVDAKDEEGKNAAPCLVDVDP